jgi:hypothetical protein
MDDETYLHHLEVNNIDQGVGKSKMKVYENKNQ